MSLLNRGTETVTVYPEVSVTDADGNTRTKASAVGQVLRAVLQPLGAPDEEQVQGYRSESRYRMRLIGYSELLGAQSQVEWNGKTWSLDGDGRVYNGSSRTRHVDYHIVRS